MIAAARPDPHPSPPLGLGLGLDVGGTQTRWALADAQGQVHAEGALAGFSGLMLASGAGRVQLAQTLARLAEAVLARGRPAAVYAGITGLAEAPAAAQMQALLGEALGLAPQRLVCGSDMEIACRCAFEPGAGYLLYAGTGSIAAFLDAQGQLQRAGGRGALLDDAGGGYWIAREALSAVWRREDEQPGAWRGSRLAQALFERLGGSDWASTRAFVYGSERGAIGRLALAVGEAAAAGDADALALLSRAGGELARLVLALQGRYGRRPVLAAGRALLLHPAIAQGLRAALPEGLELRLEQLQAHRNAAQLAARL